MVVNTLPLEVVLAIHEHLTRSFADSSDPISPPGVRSKDLLESAVYRQHTAYGDILKYATPYQSAASLMYGVCNNHPFHNGNKRTALLSGVMHLDANGMVLDGVTRSELFDLMIRIASHNLVKKARPGIKLESSEMADAEISVIADWLKGRARKIRKGERSITYGELYRILNGFGFVLGNKRHNKMEVLRKKKGLFGNEKLVCVHKVPCPGDGQSVSLKEIKHLRETLNLTEEDGVDSESFYDTQSMIDYFIRSHRGVLRQLARI